MKPKLHLFHIALAATLSVLGTASLHAVPYYWNTTTTGTWATGANWSIDAVSGGLTGTVPLLTDTAVFNQSSVNGAEIVQLSGDQGILGITFANTGTTLLNSNSASPRILTLVSGGLTVNSGAGAVTLGHATNVMNLSLGATQAWTNNSANTLTAVNGISLAITGAQTLTVTGSGNSALGGAITNGSGTLGLTKAGAGTLTLSGANLYTGNTIVSGGTLNLASGGSLTNISVLNTKGGGAMTISGTVTIASNGSFGVGAGATATTGSLMLNTGGVLNIGGGGGFTGIGGRDATGTGLGNGTLTVAGGTLNVAAPGTGTGGPGGLDATNFYLNPYGTGGGTSTVNLDGGVISTLRAFTHGGAGTTVFNLNGGTLQAASGYTGGFFIALSRVNVRNGGAVINTNGNNNSVGAALLHSNIGGDAAIDGGLTKQGIGTLTLTNTNTYTGATTVSGGILAINGSLANTSGVTVGSTATLRGSGTINSSVTIQSGGNLAPGNSIESLGLGAVSFLAGSTFAFELQTNLYAGAPGTAADLIHSSGTLDIVPGAILTLTDLATSMALANGSKLALISYLGGWTSGELFTYDGNTLADDSTFTLGANQWRFDYNDTSGGPNFSSDQGLANSFVTMTVVPEPNVVALLAAFGIPALLRRRRSDG